MQAQRYIAVGTTAKKGKRKILRNKEIQEITDQEAQEAREDRRRKREGTTQAVKVGKEILVAQEGDMTGRKTVKGEIVETAARKVEGRAKIQKAEQSHQGEDQKVTQVVMMQGKRKSQIR